MANEIGIWIVALIVSGMVGFAVAAEQPAPPSTQKQSTTAGELAFQPINHSALRFEFAGKQYYVDPAGKADWASMPKADAILITHEHQDHLNAETIAAIRKPDTVFLMSAPAAAKAGYGAVLRPGEKKQVLDVTIEGVPAYNLSKDRLNFHPKERGDVGFVLTFGDKRVYVAGDTEPTPEMKALKDIDIAFLPINLPYTMTPEQAADAARAFRPRILYPYHQGKSDPQEMTRLLADTKEIEIRVLALP
jgi:L-ascorbate metabolism protein UlaG (beta-lactamase superfamily)